MKIELNIEKKHVYILIAVLVLTTGIITANAVAPGFTTSKGWHALQQVVKDPTATTPTSVDANENGIIDRAEEADHAIVADRLIDVKMLVLRDSRPYGAPSFYWDGSEKDCNAVATNILTVKGSATIDKTTYCTSQWGHKRMFGFNSLSQEAQTNNAPPANGVWMTLPATADVHNALLISTIDNDRWSVWSVWLCDSNGNNCVKLARSSNNAKGDTYPSTYTLGPFNNMKEDNNHAWMTFPISAAQVTNYVSEGKLKFLITSGPYNDEGGRLWLSGFALVPNKYGLMQHPAVTLHWGLNGDALGEMSWYGSWNNEGLVYVNADSTKSVYVKVVDPTKDLLVTFHEHNSNWYGGSPKITAGNDLTVFRPSPSIRGVSAATYNYMRPESIIIPVSIVSSQLTTSGSGVPSVIKLNIQNLGGMNYYVRGIDTEIWS